MGLLAPLLDSDPQLGGKARSLAQLARAGLNTPVGFVVLDAVFRALCPIDDGPWALDKAGLQKLEEAEWFVRNRPWPDAFQNELRGALSGLACSRFSVRSSFAGEDMAGRLAAGVYTSVLDVPFDKVADAIRDVLCSAISPGAIAYAQIHGIRPLVGPLCVLVHSYLPGEADGSVATTGDELVLDCRRGALTEETTTQLRNALFSWVKEHGPTEIEWVVEGGTPYFLQTRPYRPPQPAPNFPGFAELTMADPPASAWHWDVAHNPLPLSPVQRGLVEIADQHCSIGIRQRVLGGYLFYTEDARSLLPTPTRSVSETVLAFMDLRRSFEERRKALGERPNVEDAITLFLSIYQPLFGEIQPVLRQEREALRTFLQQHHPAALAQLGDLLRDVPSVASERRRMAAQIGMAAAGEARARAIQQYRDRFGDEAPVWDLARATVSELPAVPGLGTMTPPRVDWRNVADSVETRIEEAFWPEYRAVLANARKAMALAEEDDGLYAQAQACLRYALCALAKHLCSSGMLQEIEDVFFLPLSEIRRWIATQTPSFDWKECVRKSRQAWEHARQHPPILNSPRDERGVVRGIGTGGRVMGQVQLHQPGIWQGLEPGRVVVARTILPMELPLLDAGALVVETGGLLDHVAVQARERNLPALVGAVGATSIFRDGDMVLVDADRGMAIRLGGITNP